MKRRLVRHLFLEQLERREVLSVAFVDTGQGFNGGAIQTVEFGDLDGDQDLDVFVLRFGEPGEIWLNDGQGHFSDSGRRIGLQSQAVALGDIDSDGDLDAVVDNSAHILLEDFDVGEATDVEPNKVWLNDGSGHFTDSGQLLGEEKYADAVVNSRMADLDGDGDLDVFVDRRIWVNDGDGGFVMNGPALSVNASALGDVDGDGDMDVVGSLATFLNDGNAVFSEWPEGTNTRLDALYVSLGDVDGDSDLDLVFPIESRPALWVGELPNVWLNDGKGHFSPSQWPDMRPEWMEIADVDIDGDLDALTARWVDVSTILFELWLNDGQGNYGEAVWCDTLNMDEVLVSDLYAARATRATFADVDNDGDNDAFFAGRLWMTEVRVFENGDADRNHQFNQLDIVQVLQSAKYRSGEPATWSEGDWNEDGVFDHKDIVAALQTGNYLQGPYAAVDAVFAQPPR